MTNEKKLRKRAERLGRKLHKRTNKMLKTRTKVENVQKALFQLGVVSQQPEDTSMVGLRGD